MMKYCGKLECPSCNSNGKCKLKNCLHPEMKNSKTIYFPSEIGGHLFYSWKELCNWIKEKSGESSKYFTPTSYNIKKKTRQTESAYFQDEDFR